LRTRFRKPTALWSPFAAIMSSDGREVKSGNLEHLVFLVHGRTSIPVSSQWIENGVTLIDILRTEMGLGQSA
jgi:hypothetical protein